MSVNRCAVCWNPGKHPWKKGELGSTWLCNVCRTGAYNRKWAGTPPEERHARQLEEDDETAVELQPDYEPGPYETDGCIEIMRLHCQGYSQVEIAEKCGCSQPWVSMVVKHWRTNNPYLIETLIEYVSKGLV